MCVILSVSVILLPGGQYWEQKRGITESAIPQVVLILGEDLNLAPLPKEQKKNKRKHWGKHLLSADGRQKDSSPAEPGGGASGGVSPVGADLPGAQVTCLLLIEGHHPNDISLANTQCLITIRKMT